MTEKQKAAPPSAPTLDEQLHDLAEPLHIHLRRVEAELTAAEAVVARLRADRSKLRTALRAVDPTFEPEGKPGPKTKTKGKPYPVSESAVALIGGLIAEGQNGDGFTASQLARQEGWPYSQSHTSQALSVLHERGVIRLDRTEQGGAKVYYLV